MLLFPTQLMISTVALTPSMVLSCSTSKLVVLCSLLSDETLKVSKGFYTKAGWLNTMNRSIVAM